MSARAAAGLPAQTEAGFQDAVLELAELRGWEFVHFRPARTAKGWRTPMIGMPGFPDLILCRPPRLIIAELKSDRGKATVDQLCWLELLGTCDGVEVHLWRPSDWNEIETVLR